MKDFFTNLEKKFTKKNVNRWFKVFLRCFIIICGVFVFINILGMVYGKFSDLIDIKSANSFYLYDENGNLIVQGRDDWVSISDINDLVIKATLAVEDRRFFEHNGFDFLRIGRAMYENVLARDIVQGASTITQQYARNLFLNFEKTWDRKIKEMLLTFKLEANYEKEEILEGYLNTINYGHGVYGISNASKFYFDKDINSLNLAEIAILVGIPNSPSNYSPIINYELAKKRQMVVLERMVDNGFISKDEMEEAYSYELVLSGKKGSDYDLSSLMYYYDAVMNELNNIDDIPKSYLETGGLRIYTALNIDAQKAIEESVSDNLVNDNVQVSKVMLRPDTGEVMALIGGADYGKSTYNRAIYSVRQPGSTIKPFLYYKALEAGFTPSTKFFSGPTTFNFEGGESYSPKNSGNIYANKEISLNAAIAYSDNIYAVKTHLFLGESELVDVLRSVGFTSKLEAVASLPLGSMEVSILEIAKGYAALANGGKRVREHLINRVCDINGNVLYNYKEEEEYVLDNNLTFMISEMLTSTYDNNLIDFAYPTCINVISEITNKYAIKSGSTYTDAWVVGYNKDAVLVSWAGYDDNTEIENNIVSSNKKSWAHAMEKYFSNNEAHWEKMPDGVVGVLVDPVSGEVATLKSKHKKILYYLKGTEPSK